MATMTTLTTLTTLTTTTTTTTSGEAEIRKHLFFRHIDWDKIAKREVQPPFKPKIRDRLDVSNFDKQFTSQKVELSPTDESFMMNLDQSMFDGFSYTCDAFRYPSSDNDDVDVDQIRIIDQCQRMSVSPSPPQTSNADSN